MMKKEIKKIGKTYIIKDNITVKEFQENFKPEEGKEVTINSVYLSNPELKGYALTNEDNSIVWFVDLKYFKENYELVN